MRLLTIINRKRTPSTRLEDLADDKLLAFNTISYS